jgi:signal transduction histidine kinase
MSAPEEPARVEEIALNPRVRENEGALLRALLQATDYGVLMSGVDRQDLVANRRLGELFDIPPRQIVALSPEQVRAIARDRFRDPQGFEDLIEEVAADPSAVRQDELEVAADPPRVIRRHTSPVRGPGGEPIGRLWTFLDITEMKRLQATVEAQLAAQTENFLATSATLRAMNELCGLAVQQQTANELLEAIVDLIAPLTAYDSAAVLLAAEDGASFSGMGRGPDERARPLGLAFEEEPALALAMSQGRVASDIPLSLYTNYSGSLARQLGARSIVVAPLIGGGAPLGVLVLGTGCPDAVLEPRRASHLSALVNQIALALETHRLQSELLAALETLQATQRRMVEMERLRTAGALAASVAHDIRNILAAMQVELALQPNLVTEAIQGHLNRFSALTHRLLAFSRPGVLDTTPTSLAEVVNRIVPLVAGQAEIAAVSITVDLPPDLPLALADAMQLEHLFVNLCLNAIQAMAEQGGTLVLEGRPAGDHVEVLVSDTGGGIAPENVARLFDPFFTTRANGLGLGLFSCRRIVEDHGGELRVESAHGRGARFTVSLPAAPGGR